MMHGQKNIKLCFNEVCVGACLYRMLATTLPHADSVTGLNGCKYLTIEQRGVILKLYCIFVAKIVLSCLHFALRRGFGLSKVSHILVLQQ
jgi:hypothetical protein